MGKLKKKYFYYGAILSTILQHNPDASPMLILNDNDSRQVYRIFTNTSKKEYILFFKYANCKQQEPTSKYYSWTFSFSNDDKEKLKSYSMAQSPIFIYLLCLRKNFQDSEIAIINYEEYLPILNNQTITIGLENNKHHFYLFQGKSRENACRIQTNRINKNFNDLMKQSLRFPTKPIIKNASQKTTLNISDLTPQKLKHYPDNIFCPLCKNLLEEIEIYDKQNILKAKKCLACNKTFLCEDYYKKVCKTLNTKYLHADVLIMDYNLAIETKAQHISSFPDDKTTKFNDTIFVLKNEPSSCPIHHSQLKVKVIDWGKGKKDTVLYCSQCNKMMIGSKHKKSFESIMNSQKHFKKYKFENFKII